MKKTIIYTSGMHCNSCEVLLEKTLAKVPGVTKVVASQHTGKIEISYSGTSLDQDLIESMIRENGYQIGKTGSAPWFNPDISVYAQFILGLLVIGLVSIVFASNSIFSTSSWLDATSATLLAPLLIGLAAGVSSCMAMVGGLILGVSAKWNEDHLSKSRFHRFLPHLYLNLGRVIGFTVFGAVLGSIGSVLAISSGILGLLTLGVALVMFFLGLSLTELSPRLAHFSLTLPKSWGSKVESPESRSPKVSAFITGVLTFFLPCGFTFAMQLAAMESGTALSGAMILGLFALGTAPGLLGIGGITAFFRGKGGKIFFRFMGAIVLTLAIWNFSNGLNLAFGLLHSRTTIPAASQENIQSLPSETIRLNYTSNGLSEPKIPVKKGGNYTITIDVKDTVSGCMNTILIPGLDEHIQYVNAGNTVQFHIQPTEAGEYPIVCAMGLEHGTIVVE